MTKNDIITIPNPLLRQKSQRISHIDASTQKLAQDLIDATLDWEDSREHELGAALASVQVAQPYRVVVIRNDFDNKADRTFSVLINPEIVKTEGEPVEELEGCLSVADIYGSVARYPKIKVKARNLAGQEVRITAKDFLARVLQHEIDHTKGIVFVDRVDDPTKLRRLDPSGKFVPLLGTQDPVLNPDSPSSRDQDLVLGGERQSIVFFGTGQLSLEALQALSQNFQIEAVITKPDSISSSGKTRPSLVKLWAAEQNLPIYEPSGAVELNKLFIQKSFKSRLGIVVDYGFLIPPPVISYFPLGIINSHFSLLPEWRGADPITAALLSGQDTTGVSLMLIVPKLDEGKLIAQKECKIPTDITTPELEQALSNLSNKVLEETLPHYLAGEIKPWHQSAKIKPTYSQKLTKSDGLIDWTKPAEQIERQIRAYLGWPGSKTTIAGKEVTITAAHVGSMKNEVRSTTKSETVEPIHTPYSILHTPRKPGTAFKTDAGKLAVQTGQGVLIIDKLKPAGKPEMTGQAFLAGHRLK